MNPPWSRDQAVEDVARALSAANGTPDGVPLAGGDHLCVYRADAEAAVGVLWAKVQGLCDDLREAQDRQIPAGPALVYAWSDGITGSVVDKGTLPDDPRDRAILRALLAYTLDLLDNEERR